MIESTFDIFFNKYWLLTGVGFFIMSFVLMEIRLLKEKTGIIDSYDYRITSFGEFMGENVIQFLLSVLVGMLTSVFLLPTLYIIYLYWGYVLLIGLGIGSLVGIKYGLYKLYIDATWRKKK